MLMPNIPSYAICLFLIKVLTLKVDISGERCTCKFRLALEPFGSVNCVTNIGASRGLTILLLGLH